MKLLIFNGIVLSGGTSRFIAGDKQFGAGNYWDLRNIGLDLVTKIVTAYYCLKNFLRILGNMVLNF